MKHDAKTNPMQKSGIPALSDAMMTRCRAEGGTTAWPKYKSEGIKQVDIRSTCMSVLCVLLRVRFMCVYCLI